ncbi:MAG: rod shape-determining protein MreC [Oscillospiraceae bacterium]|nr:rod shape-determining protein MreC [Oscillospiraceae bacterium]
MKNNPFKIVIAVIAVLVGMALYAGVNGRLMTLPQEIMGAVSVPFRSVTAQVSNKFSVWKDRTVNIDQIIEENEQLRKENQELKQKQIDYDKIKIENEKYKEFLEIKEENPEYEIAAASVIGRDGMEKFYSFTIDAGEDDGIEVNDVVMSSIGVVGVVVETGPNFSRVSTILSPSVSVASFVSSTRDTGVVCGDSRYSSSGKTLIRYLPKNTDAEIGDIISTTGMGEVFPKDLLVGTIEEIITDTSGNYSYAVVKPASEISEVKTVFIIKSY